MIATIFVSGCDTAVHSSLNHKLLKLRINNTSSVPTYY